MKKLWITDCEGPVTLDDNAHALAEHFIPNGGAFFAKLSKYDDYLADIEKRAGYVAGMTLRLILPFLKAYGATDAGIKEFSAQHISLVPTIVEAMTEINKLMPCCLISTSYEHYVSAVCKMIGFDEVFCTELKIDSYKIFETEIDLIHKIAHDIDQLTNIMLPPDAKYFTDLSQDTRRTIHRLDEIFWEKIAEMESGKMYLGQTVIGGPEKLAGVEAIVEKYKTKFSDVIYVGDSITDGEALDYVNRSQGLAISFNGNRYAVEAATIAVIATNTEVMKQLAWVFDSDGRTGVIRQLVDKIQFDSIPDSYDDALANSAFPIIRVVTTANEDALIRLSEQTRKKVRGAKVGALG